MATVEHGGCADRGCDAPPGMTHLHHPTRWADGGDTNRDGIMICPPHHSEPTTTRYHDDQTPRRQVTFHRRT